MGADNSHYFDPRAVPFSNPPVLPQMVSGEHVSTSVAETPSPSGVILVKPFNASDSWDHAKGQSYGHLTYCLVSHDEDLYHLNALPTFIPLLNTHISPDVRVEDIDRINPAPAVRIAHSLEKHLRLCAMETVRHQNRLSERIRDSDNRLTHAAGQINDRVRIQGKHSEQIMRVEEISQMLKKLQQNVERSVHMLNDLNKDLPLNLRMEPFIFSSHAN